VGRKRKPPADLKQQLESCRRELAEAREQQTATSDVLRVISSSPGELQPVFQAMLANAVRICEAKFGSMYLLEGDAFRIVGMHNAPPAFAEARRLQPLVLSGPGTGSGVAAGPCQAINEPTADRVGNDHEYNWHGSGVCSNGPKVELPVARMTSGLSPTNSVAYLRVLSALPAPQRYSISTFWPSIQPNC
jgi:hypothetical protein